MATYESAHAGQSASVCASVEGLINPNSTAAPAECRVALEVDVFVNNLYVGVAGVLAPVLSVALVGPMGKRALLSEYNDVISPLIATCFK